MRTRHVRFCTPVFEPGVSPLSRLTPHRFRGARQDLINHLNADERGDSSDARALDHLDFTVFART